MNNTSIVMSAEALAKLFEKLRGNFVAAVPVDRPEHAKLVVMLQQRLAVFLEVSQPCLPHLWVVVRSPCQRLARDIIFAIDLWCVECGVVDTSRCLVYPAVAYAIDDYVTRSVEVDYHVDGHDVVELYRLHGGSWEAVEYE